MNKLYLNDSYLNSVKTYLHSASQVTNYTTLLCEDLLYHPEGGGQPNDAGEVNILGGNYKIRDLVKQHGEILIALDADALSYEDLNMGDEVICNLDWGRRYRLMRLHTAGHVLMAAARQSLANYEAKGIKIQENADEAVIKFLSDGQFTDQMLSRIDNIAKDVIKKNLRVEAQSYGSIQEAQSFYGPLFRIDPKLNLKGKVRIVTIDGFDANPCGGTHVKTLGEIGRIMLEGMRDQNINGEFELKYSLDTI